MAPKQNPRIRKAFHAMKELGLSEETVKPALKNLLRVYEKNWAYIEDENYRVLVDAIFEIEDEMKRKPNNNDQELHQPEQPLKRHRPSHGSQYESSNVGRYATGSGNSFEGANTNSDTALADIYLQPLQTVMEPPNLAVNDINPMDESEPESPPTSLRLRDRHRTSSKALAIVEASSTNEALHSSQMDLQNQHIPNGEEETYSERSPQLLFTKTPEIKPQTIPEMVTDIFTLNEPKAEPVVTEIPTEELAITIFQPETAAEMYGSDFFPLREVGIYEKSKQTDVGLSSQTNHLSTSILHDNGGTTDNLIENVEGRKVLEVGSGKAVSVNADDQDETGSYNAIYLLDASDITRGEEKLKISIVNRLNNVPLPTFCYMNKSLIGQNARVNASLALIGKGDCCPNCVGDCLSLKEPLMCACTTGERCVYATNGFLTERFLEENISMTHNPEKHKQIFCDHCPLEVGTDTDARKPCKGHVVKKVVKECWLKCHCSQNCTNRRVQRGISCKLQVFMTSGAKGWGLRTIEDLPKGAFVCEYVGEILTLSELYIRTQSCIRNSAYAMVLDAGWASSIDLKEDKDKVLCLDASVYGNVARFINHRCTDGNLVAIPVRVESSDPLYHRVAFFTSRKVAALEELTRDYGVNFEVFDSVTKPFRCCCGSRFCRNIKHYNRKRRKENSPKPFFLKTETLDDHS